MPQRGARYWQRGMYLFWEGGRVLSPRMYMYKFVLENCSKGTGSHTPINWIWDEHEVTNVLNRRYCLMRPDGQYCYYGDPVVILLPPVQQLSRPHIAPLA